MINKSIILSAILLISFVNNAQNLSVNTTASFTYTPASPLNNKPIEVFYHIPEGNMATMPILFSFHGVNRNADDYRDYWISMSNQHKFMVFAPQFSKTYFPGGDAYNLANVFDDGDNPSEATYNPKNEWTFSVIDPIFETIKTSISGTQETYNAWGHSAGSQFLQRFVLFLPESKLDIAVCSNAGWYTVPESEVNFPYGIKEGQLPNSNLIAAFSKKLIVHLGKNDNNPNASGLRRNSVVDNQQGIHRLERGNYFFSTAGLKATSLNTNFNWEKDEVEGVDHNAQLMANDALQHILKSTLTIKNFENNELKFFPNPVHDFLFFDNTKLQASEIKIFSIQGKLIRTFDFNQFNGKQMVDTSTFSRGIYILKVKNRLQKFIKI